jgi:hypothetical protein
VVGRDTCEHRYGDDWAVSRLTGLAVGVMMPAFVVERLDAPAIDRTDPVIAPTGRTAPARTLAIGGRRSLTAIGGRSGLRWRGRHLELGIELSAAGGAPPPIDTRVDGVATPVTDDLTVVDAGALIAVHHRVGRIGGALELYVGGRSIAVPVELPPGFRPTITYADRYGSAVVSPRVRVDAWVSRYITIEATAGYDPLGGGGSIALGFAVHPERYDGT